MTSFTSTRTSNYMLLFRSAALEVVKLLHQKGELGENLQVKKRTRLAEVDEDEDEEDEETSLKYYKKLDLSILTEGSSSSDPLYLHVIHLTLVWTHIIPPSIETVVNTLPFR